MFERNPLDNSVRAELSGKREQHDGSRGLAMETPASLVVHVVTEFVTVPLACVGTEALCNSPLIRQGLLARRRGALQEVFCVGVHVSSLKDAY